MELSPIDRDDLVLIVKKDELHIPRAGLCADVRAPMVLLYCDGDVLEVGADYEGVIMSGNYIGFDPLGYLNSMCEQLRETGFIEKMLDAACDGHFIPRFLPGSVVAEPGPVTVFGYEVMMHELVCTGQEVSKFTRSDYDVSGPHFINHSKGYVAVPSRDLEQVVVGEDSIIGFMTNTPYEVFVDQLIR